MSACQSLRVGGYLALQMTGEPVLYWLSAWAKWHTKGVLCCAVLCYFPDYIILDCPSVQPAVLALQVYKTEGPRPSRRPTPQPTPNLSPVHNRAEPRDAGHKSRVLLDSKPPLADGKRSTMSPSAKEQDGKNRFPVCQPKLHTWAFGYAYFASQLWTCTRQCIS